MALETLSNLASAAWTAVVSRAMCAAWTAVSRRARPLHRCRDASARRLHRCLLESAAWTDVERRAPLAPQRSRERCGPRSALGVSRALRGSLEIQLATHKPVKARFWRWLQPSSVRTCLKPCKSSHVRSQACCSRHRRRHALRPPAYAPLRCAPLRCAPL